MYVTFLCLLVAVIWWTLTASIEVPVRCPTIRRLKYGNDFFEFDVYPPHTDKYMALVRSRGKLTHPGSLYMSITAREDVKFVIHKLCVRTRDVGQINLVYEGWLPPGRRDVFYNGTSRVKYERAMLPRVAREKILVYSPHILTTSCIRSRGVNNKIHINLLKVKGTQSIQVKDVKLAACLM